MAERKYDDGKNNATGALRRFPNHLSAASCLAYIYGAQSNPDSLLWALERAAIGDSAITQVWAQLGDIYLGAGDTTRAVGARILEVETDPADVQRRMRVVRSMDDLGKREVAVSLMEAGVAQFGEDLEFRRVLVRMCLQYEMWECALENLGALYALDPGLAGDTAFLFQMIGLAQATVDPEVWEQVGLVYLDVGTQLVRDRDMAQPSCELVYAEQALVDGVADGLREYQSLIPQFYDALSCDANPSRDSIPHPVII